jgi:hypothetical protein
MSIKIVLQNNRRRRRVQLPTVAGATTLCFVQALRCLDGSVSLIPQLDRHWQRYRQRLDVSPDALRLWTFVTGETAWIPGDDAPGVLLCHQPGDPLEILTLGCARDRRQRASQCPRLIAHGHADALFANVQGQRTCHVSQSSLPLRLDFDLGAECKIRQAAKPVGPNAHIWISLQWQRLK